MENLRYETVSRVLETWDSARRMSKDHGDFEKDFGKAMIDKFVELQPRSKQFYGSDDLMQKHADGIVNLLDSILQMLGPDTEFIEEILAQVGARHAKMGVNVAFFPFLGQALTWALEQRIGTDDVTWTPEHKEAWEEVYDAISQQIVKAILNANAKA